MAGIVNGLLGSGGGIILVPLFLSWIKLDGKKAFATSVSTTLPMSLATMAVCFFGGNIPSFSKALPYLIGGGVGGIVAGTLLKKLPTLWLRRIFGALLIIGGVKTFL
ncbi:MAG: TSUP family transporter [Clostridia bacterium]|nr:TSUP family transporter [Clostridia bacterium]